MINNPQTSSFAVLGELGLDVTVGTSAAPEPDASAPGDAIAAPAGPPAATGASLLEAAQQFPAAPATAFAEAGRPDDAAAQRGLSPVAASAQTRAAASLEATLQHVLTDVAAMPAGAPLANPALARTLLALAQGAVHASVPGGAQRAPAALLEVAALVRALGAAQTPAESAAALQRLGAALLEHRDEVAAAAALQTPAATRGENAAAIPWWDPHFRTLAGAREPRTSGAEAERVRREARVDAVPARDSRGRPYTGAERARLSTLGLDPRAGFAPEAEVALAAETLLGLRFSRAPDARHDYVDESGAAWDVLAPRAAAGLEAGLRRLAAEANVLLGGARLEPADLPAVLALVARLADSAGLRRIAAVGVEGI